MDLASNRPESQQWLQQLRRRFVDLATRRVPEDAVEDVVQDAMTIVVEKGARLGEAELVDGMPPLAWCFTVLRNTVGNFYQKKRTRSREADLELAGEVEGGITPLEALQSRQVLQLLHEALDRLDQGGDACGRYLRAVAEGTSPAQIADQEGVGAAVLYRRVYRCREKLRQILSSRGVLT